MPDPCARALAEYPRLVSLPLYPSMTNADVDRVSEAVRDIAVRFRKDTRRASHEPVGAAMER